MSNRDAFLRLKSRLEAGEPFRILIGERLYGAAEIIPSPDFATRIRDAIVADTLREIARLGEPEIIVPEQV